MAPRKKSKPAVVNQSSPEVARNGVASHEEEESRPAPEKKTKRAKKEEDPVPKRGRGGRAVGLAASTIPENEESSGVMEEPKPSEAVPVVTGVKRGRRPSKVQEEMRAAKRQKLLPLRQQRGWGQVLTVGQGDTGQLGLGEDVMEKSRPAVVTQISAAVDAVAGGMHTVVLDSEGQVWTFGCNDEGSLGRTVEEEEECFLPGKVTLPEKVVMLSAGDSHTAALSQSGQVYIWGTFRDSSGPIGLVEDMKIEKTPVKVLAEQHVTKIVSGADHLAMLTSDGQLWTMGNSEQGQLGRVSEKFSQRGGRRGLTVLLSPELVRLNFKSKLGVITDVWAGSYNTLARTESGQMLVMGLNNYSQMALPLSKGLTFYMPHKSKNLTALSWRNIAIGQHHAICLEDSGSVYALGRSEYGRLGLGSEETEDAVSPTNISRLKDCVEVSCGTAVSYAVTRAGECFSWGMGTNGQLGTGEEEDVFTPTKMEGKQLKGKKVVAVSSGGQHTVLIAQN